MKRLEEQYGFKVGDKVRRKSKKKTYPNNQPTKIILEFFHNGGSDFVLFEGGAMSAKGLESYEKVK